MPKHWDPLAADPNAPGMPRPIAFHEDSGRMLPVPWSQDWRDSDTDSRRYPAWGKLGDHSIVAPPGLCLVCGLKVKAGSVFVAMEVDVSEDVVDANSFGPRDLAYAIDAGAMHERCAKLTAAHCPHLKEALAYGSVIEVEYCDQDHT